MKRSASRSRSPARGAHNAGGRAGDELTGGESTARLFRKFFPDTGTATANSPVDGFDRQPSPKVRRRMDEQQEQED